MQQMPLLAEIAMPLLWAGIAIVLVGLLWMIAIYNGLVRARNHCDESWSNVDTELKRRYDLIPNLVETVKAYATHEQATLEAVIEARNQAAENNGPPTSQAASEGALISSLKRMFALAEGYPELKASHNFLALQDELTTTENRIQRARRFYNGNVRDLANRIETFPSTVVASMYGFQRREFFEIEDSSQRERPGVDFSA